MIRIINRQACTQFISDKNYNTANSIALSTIRYLKHLLKKDGKENH